MNYMTERRTGSDLVAEFVARRCHANVFLVTGGAAAFMIDGLERHKEVRYTCYQHEQAAAMAADAVYRVSEEVGVTMATSGPGATNLITGIASSWFDSIPALHITGQINDRESKRTLGVEVRQAGFQETDIVQMVSSITKFAVKVQTVGELAEALPKALNIALSGRQGPVLIDVPMNVQQDEATQHDFDVALASFSKAREAEGTEELANAYNQIHEFLIGAARPLVVFGGGLSLTGSTAVVQSWCEEKGIPYVSSWAGLALIDRARPLFQGTQGVYGVRHANWTVQAADKILILGNRLDNRQRTGNPRAYAPFAEVLAIDIDAEELKKLQLLPNYRGIQLDLVQIERALPVLDGSDYSPWRKTLLEAKLNQDTTLSARVAKDELDPYAAFEKIAKYLKPESIVIADTGATLCWLMQVLTEHTCRVFTAGGNSPMGYSLPAAIGAQLAEPDAEITCVIGDGGLQMNIQELQTAVAHNLPITIIVANNAGYGIIKQFQDANTSSRYAATGNGYTVPDFGAISNAYGIEHHVINSIDDITSDMFSKRLKVIELLIPEGALVAPKTEGDRFIHDQFPFQIEKNPVLPYSYPERVSELNELT